MADNMNDDMVMDLDLNQEPLVEQPPPLIPPQPPSFGYGPLLTELETAHGRIEDRIEDRIRQLEAVTARARQRQRWRQARNNPELSYVGLGIQNFESSDIVDEVRVEDMGGGGGGDGGRGRSSKRDIRQFTPIITGCKGEVTDSSITPIYGNGKTQSVLKLESGMRIPPRPRARRVESIKQQRVIRGISHIPVAEALRRIRIGIGSIGENPLLQGLNRVGSGSVSETNPPLLHSSEAGGSRRHHHRSRQFSRVISESAASLSSISSALNNAERLVEDLETYINERLLRRADTPILPSVQEVNTYLANSVEIPPEPQNAEMNLPVSNSSSSQLSVATTGVHLDHSSTNSGVEIDLTASLSRPSSSSRRIAVSRALSLEGGTSRELRRRRMRSLL